jgi:hypothetical protein
MSKLILIILFIFPAIGFSQPSPGIPPTQQLDPTNKDEKAKEILKLRTSFVELASSSIATCSKSDSKAPSDFLEIYNYLALRKIEIDKKADCEQCKIVEDEFFNCLVTFKFTDNLSKLIEHKYFYKLMLKDHKLPQKEAKQMKKFYSKLIKDRLAREE